MHVLEAERAVMPYRTAERTLLGDVDVTDIDLTKPCDECVEMWIAASKVDLRRECLDFDEGLP